MKLGAALTLGGLGIGVAAFAVATGCGDSKESGTVAETGKIVPEETGDPTASTEERVFAINSISLGEADRAGNKNPDAWKKYGFNLDALITKVTDRNSPSLQRVCKLQTAATAGTHQDGEEGTDNSFGKNVIPILSPVAANPSADVTDGIKNGQFTILFKIIGLTNDPAQTNTNLSGTLLVGAKFNEDKNVLPTFSPADDWPYFQDPQIPMNGAYINKGVFVNGRGGATVKISVDVQGQSLSLTINKAIVSFKHNPQTKSLEEGTIAGVLGTEELLASVGALAGRADPQYCQGAVIDGIKSSLKGASDILADGSQDPARTCDGISIGLGFTAKQVGQPTKVAPSSGPSQDPCTQPAGDAGP